MTEIRTIRPEESDAFLQVLCDVFSITFDRVRGVFYGEPFYDLNRKWAVFDDGEIVSILSTTPLEFGWGRASGIAGVGTIPDARGRGFATELLERVTAAHKAAGETALFLFAEDPRVYRKLGFVVLDEVHRGPLECTIGDHDRLLDLDSVQSTYDRWAVECPNRLRRDERRWRYWKWNLRLCAPHGTGYLCQEGALVREAVGGDGASSWKTSEPCDWLGLRSVGELVGAPMVRWEKATHLMGHGTDVPPCMFLTDQW